MKSIFICIFSLMAPTIFAQLTKYDDFGLTFSGKEFVLNKEYKISKGLNYNYSFGLYYNHIRSDFYSIPIYLTFSQDCYKYNNVGKKKNEKYIDFEVTYRRYVIFSLGPRIYLEAGVQNRFLTNSNKITTSNNDILFLRKYNLIPKLGIGVEIYGRNKPFAYINLEFYNSVLGMFESEKKPLNKYLGFKILFPLKHKK